MKTAREIIENYDGGCADHGSVRYAHMNFPAGNP